MIEIKDLQKVIEGRTVIDLPEITVKDGEISALVGRAGSEKSTLLSLLIGETTPSMGDIRFDGVDLSDNECLKEIPLISLNELARERHNAYFKLFSSHKVERESAFKLLENEELPYISEPLESLLSGLRLLRGEQDMRELTTKEVQELGERSEHRGE